MFAQAADGPSVGVGLLAKNSRTPRSTHECALSLAIFASKLAPTGGWISDCEGMLGLALVITQSTGLARRFQKAHHRLATVPARGLVFHVQKMPGGLEGAEAAVRHVLAEQLGILGAGVFVPFTVQEQHRHVDLPRRLEVAQPVAVQHLADVKVHLPVFVLGQAAHVFVVEALEQRR